jgi:phage tail-like protein
MVEFPVNPTRVDPYKQFKFRLKWDNKYVAGVSKVSALKRTTEVVEHREGGDPSTAHKSPGRTKYEAITLERGVTQDTDFEAWANKVWNFGAVLELLNEQGQVVHAYKIYRCWPSDYVALGALDADHASVAFEQLILQNEGWERDTSVVEPKET